MQEIWKDIEGFEGLYQISNLGRIKSLSKFINNNPKSKKIGFYSKEKIIKFSKSKNNYLIAPLSKKGKAYYFYVHRLVAKTFINNLNNFKQVDHIDGNKQNNCINNLEWVTPKENINRAWKKGLCKPHSKHIKVLNNIE